MAKKTPIEHKDIERIDYDLIRAGWTPEELQDYHEDFSRCQI